MDQEFVFKFYEIKHQHFNQNYRDAHKVDCKIISSIQIAQHRQSKPKFSGILEKNKNIKQIGIDNASTAHKIVYTNLAK